MKNEYMTNEEIMLEKITQILETSATFHDCENSYSIAQNRVHELLKQVSDNPLQLIDELDSARAALINAAATESYLQGMKDALAIMTREIH